MRLLVLGRSVGLKKKTKKKTNNNNNKKQEVSEYEPLVPQDDVKS